MTIADSSELTRKQFAAMGISRYMILKIESYGMHPIGKRKSAFIYSISGAIDALIRLLNEGRIVARTRKLLEDALKNIKALCHWREQKSESRTAKALAAIDASSAKAAIHISRARAAMEKHRKGERR